MSLNMWLNIAVQHPKTKQKYKKLGNKQGEKKKEKNKPKKKQTKKKKWKNWTQDFVWCLFILFRINKQNQN